MEKRYERNLPALKGGAGNARTKTGFWCRLRRVWAGIFVEYMTRMGVGAITAVDGDVFDVSNLNRQLLSTVAQLGRSKALAAKLRARSGNPAVARLAVEAYFDGDNASALVQGHDLVLAALDNIPARCCWRDTCASYGVYIVHGAIHGWSAQVLVAEPGRGLLHRLYPRDVPPWTKAACRLRPPFMRRIQDGRGGQAAVRRHRPALSGKLCWRIWRSMDWDIIDL
jgi:molybdopterin/thiamine biosynthesis adenylyltransferase